MKEILYKAKTKVISGDAYNGGKADGEWVKGFVYDDIGCWKIKQFDFDYCDYLEYEVDPETISQYINIDDIKGEKLFEGDVVHVIGNKNREDCKDIDYIGYIVYMYNCFCVIDGRPNCFSKRTINLLPTIVELEKIGNIHDNPELVPIIESDEE